MAPVKTLGTVLCWRLLASHSDSIDVTGVSREGLLAGAFPHVPQLGQRVTGSGDEGVHVGGQSQGHAVSNVVGEDHLLLACLQIPQAADGTRGKIAVREDVESFSIFFFNPGFS